jgi:hypothetical protein
MKKTIYICDKLEQFGIKLNEKLESYVGGILLINIILLLICIAK